MHDKLDPLYEAVGRAVISAAGVEVWLYSTVALISDWSYDDADRAGPKKAIQRLRARADDFEVGPRRVGFLALLDATAAVMDKRNSLVHGIWHANEDHTVIRSQRPPRGTKADSFSADFEDRPRWVGDTFTRATLLELERDCRGLAGRFQLGFMEWTEALGLDDDED